RRRRPLAELEGFVEPELDLVLVGKQAGATRRGRESPAAPERACAAVERLEQSPSRVEVAETDVRLDQVGREGEHARLADAVSLGETRDRLELGDRLLRT